MVASHKTENGNSIWLTFTIPGNIPQRVYTLLQRHWIIRVHCCSFHNNQTKCNQPRYPSTDEVIMKMWFIYLMYVYLHIESEIIIFSGKQIKNEKDFVKQVTQSKRWTVPVLSHMWSWLLLTCLCRAVKVRKVSSEAHDPGEKEQLRRSWGSDVGPSGYNN